MTKHRKEQDSGPSQRQLRVGELVRHALAEVLSRGEAPDEVLGSHPVTVPEVRMSPDLKLATAYVMPLGGRDQKKVLDALERNKKYLRGENASPDLGPSVASAFVRSDTRLNIVIDDPDDLARDAVG